MLTYHDCVLADTLCCADEIAETVHGRGATSAQKNAIRESVKKFRGDICQQIELSNDPVYKGPICMNSVRSKSAPNHNCARGELIFIRVDLQVYLKI